jgi:hypothetical protein
MKSFQKCLWLSLICASGLWAQGEEGIWEGGMAPSLGGNISEPNTNVSMGALQATLRSPLQNERKGPDDPSAPRAMNPITSDYELALYSIPAPVTGVDDITGNTHSMRLAWGRSLPNGQYAYGARSTIQYSRVTTPNATYNPATTNYISHPKTYGYLNIALGGFGEKSLIRAADRIAAAGVSLDLILLDGAFANKIILDTRLSKQLSAYGRYSQWFGIHRINSGAMLQEILAGNLTQTNFGLACQYIASVHQSLDLKADILWKYIFLQDISNITGITDPDNAAEMHIGVGGVYWWTDAIGIDFGYRTTMLVEDLNMHTFVVGGRFAF